MTSNLKAILVNLSLFQIGWFVCVLAGNQSALIYTVVALFLHERLVMANVREWWLILAIVAVGVLWDALMVALGLMMFPASDFLGLPIWLICLWFLFATTLSHCLAWLQKRLLIGAFLAAISGPASYFGGSYLSDAQLSQPLAMSLAVMALGWAILFPLGLYGARRIANA